MTLFTLENPVFTIWAVAALVTAVKILLQGWATVHVMLRENAGFAAPEDLRRTALNTAPDPAQLAPNDKVERSRRMHRNDLENIPAFWVIGLVFVATDPPLWAAWLCLGGFVLSRACHTIAYATAQNHEVRATFWTIGSVLTIAMAVWSLIAIV